MIVGAFESTFPFRMATSALPPQARHGTSTSPTTTPSPAATPTSVTPSVSVPRNLTCGYPSKICTNERAWKRDGSLHRFCEEHRMRANTNQKRWAQRKARTKGEKPTGSSSSSDSASAVSDASMSSPSPPAGVEEYDVDESMLQAKAPMDFSDFDMTLELLLKDANFWSPTAATMSATGRVAQWECEELATHTMKEEDAMEAELWAALGLGNVNISL